MPLSFFGGIGGASRLGILVKGSNYLEAPGSTETVVFDKTGTLTDGTFSVTELVCAPGVSKAELADIAAAAETFSTHPIAQSVRAYRGAAVAAERVRDVREVSGQGVGRSWTDAKCSWATASSWRPIRSPSPPSRPRAPCST